MPPITFLALKQSMLFERFMGKVHNGMLQTCMAFFQRANMFKNTCEALGLMEIIVCEISTWGANPYISHGLSWSLNQTSFTALFKS